MRNREKERDFATTYLVQFECVCVQWQQINLNKWDEHLVVETEAKFDLPV